MLTRVKIIKFYLLSYCMQQLLRHCMCIRGMTQMLHCAPMNYLIQYLGGATECFLNLEIIYIFFLASVSKKQFLRTVILGICASALLTCFWLMQFSDVLHRAQYLYLLLFGDKQGEIASLAERDCSRQTGLICTVKSDIPRKFLKNLT